MDIRERCSQGRLTGNISITLGLDILLTQNRLVDAHNSYLEAYLDYRRAIIDMTAVTSGSGYGRGRSFSRDRL